MTPGRALPLAAVLAAVAGGAHAQSADTIRADPGPTPSRWATPFAVETTGAPTPHRVQGEVVWVVPQRAAPDTAQASEPAEPADSAEAAPPPRRTAARDTAARTARPGTRPAPRDTAARAPARATPRDTARTAPRPRPRTHTVAGGETLSGIARRYGVTTAQLRVLNPDATADGVEEGAVLRLPPAPRPAAPPSRDTAGTRPAPPRRDTATAAARPSARRTHTVAAGETLYALSRRYGVSTEAIRRANGMSETTPLRTGQKVVIPAP
jgi:LysM repeat protein